MKKVEITKIGNMRRKIKRVSNIQNKKKTKEHSIYERNVNRLNELIESIELEDYTKFKILLDTEMEDIAFSVEKYDILKSSKINFKEFKDNRLEMMYSYYCDSLDRPVKFNKDAYNFFKSNFELDALSIICKFIEEIIIMIEKKQYLIKETNYTQEEINESFNILKLDNTEIPDENNINKNYNLLKDDKTIDKDKLDFAYQLLLERYVKK